MKKKIFTLGLFILIITSTAYASLHTKVQTPEPQVSFTKLEQMLQKYVFEDMNRNGKHSVGLDPDKPFEVVNIVSNDRHEQIRLFIKIMTETTDQFMWSGEFISQVDYVLDSFTREVAIGHLQDFLGMLFYEIEDFDNASFFSPQWADGVDLKGTPWEQFVGRPLLEPGDFVVKVNLISKGYPDNTKQYKGTTFAFLTPSGDVKFELFLWEYTIPH